MTARDPNGRSRWHRLRPHDGTDLTWLVVIGIGLLLTVGALAGLNGSELGIVVVGFVLAPLLAIHGSSPALAFLGLTAYLTRGGRSIGRERVWVWVGFGLTAPLWFLAGQPLAGRGGDLTFLVVLWNLAALGVMAVGVVRTLRER